MKNRRRFGKGGNRGLEKVFAKIQACGAGQGSIQKTQIEEWTEDTNGRKNDRSDDNTVRKREMNQPMMTQMSLTNKAWG